LPQLAAATWQTLGISRKRCLAPDAFEVCLHWRERVVNVIAADYVTETVDYDDQRRLD
jgi:hypothetical protein